MWTARLAESIVRTDVRAAPTPIREKASLTIADTVGCILAGLPTQVGRMVAEYAQVPTTVDARQLWGRQDGAGDRERLALIGGAAGAALDYDDVSSNGHPSSILVSTALALSMERPVSGEEFLDAYLIGYEVAARLGDAIHLAHFRHGWHTTSTIGYFSATATACRLLDLDVETTRRALGLAASMVAGIGQNFGTMTKPLHSGLAARGGLTAAGLAAAGATSAADALEGPRGFFAVYGLGQAAPGELERFGEPWAMEEQSPSLKKYPACYVAHRAIDAMLRLQDEHDLRPDDVQRIVVRAPTRSAGTLAYVVPETGLEAKFSAHYATAAAFLDRRVTIASFTDEMARRPEIRQLIARMDVTEDSRCRPEDPEAKRSTPIAGGFWEITIHTTDGRSMQTVSEEPPGSPSRQLGWSEIKEKFLDCAASAGYDVSAAEQAAVQLKDLNTVPDIRAVMDGLSIAPFHAPPMETAVTAR